MDKREMRILYNECRDWSSIQEMMSEEEYRAFLKMASELQK